MNESIPDDKLRALLNVVVNKWFMKWASRAGKLLEELDARWRGGSYPEYDPGYRKEGNNG